MDNFKSRYLVIAIIILILIIIGLMIYGNSSNKNDEDYTNLTQEEIISKIDEEIEETTTLNLATMSERDRIDNYVTQFFDAVREEKYDEAYEMLYPDFKENKYPSIEDFTNFVKQNFPKYATITYDNIERNGDYYYIWTTIKSLTATKEDGSKTFIFAIKEYDVNDFVLSFSIK